MINFSEKTPNKFIIVKDLEELSLFAKNFLQEISKPTGSSLRIVGLSGDLGAGKTTFSKYIAKELGIQEIVTSPTFGIQKQYKVFNPEHAQIFSEFIHIDAYRIESIKETESLRFDELFQTPGRLIFIEWPEKIGEILPKETIMLSFESLDENTRKILY